MTEGLFVLVTMFVAYVVYVIVGEEAAEALKKQAKGKDAESVAEKAEAEEPVASKSEPSETTQEAEAVVEQPVVEKPAAEKPVEKKVAEKPKPQAKKTPAKKAAEEAKATAEKTAKAKKAKPQKPAPNKLQLRNPETDDVSAVPNGYRFYKRWIKEAMVKEGLLEKIYKNNELNKESNAKIRAALEKMKAMDKYKV